MKFNMIVACCKNNGIGFQNSIPWFIRNDLKYFSKTTKGNGNNAVIMGRKTWESIRKPLPKRDNIILTRSVKIHKDIQEISSECNISCFQSCEQALSYCENKSYDEIWIIGGTAIYNYFYENFFDNIDKIYLTRINKEYTCDTFFPDITPKFTMTNCNITTEKDTTTDEEITVEYQIYEKTD